MHHQGTLLPCTSYARGPLGPFTLTHPYGTLYLGCLPTKSPPDLTVSTITMALLIHCRYSLATAHLPLGPPRPFRVLPLIHGPGPTPMPTHPYGTLSSKDSTTSNASSSAVRMEAQSCTAQSVKQSKLEAGWAAFTCCFEPVSSRLSLSLPALTYCWLCCACQPAALDPV